MRYWPGSPRYSKSAGKDRGQKTVFFRIGTTSADAPDEPAHPTPRQDASTVPSMQKNGPSKQAQLHRLPAPLHRKTLLGRLLECNGPILDRTRVR